MPLSMSSDRRKFKRIEVTLVASLKGLSPSKTRGLGYLLTKDVCDKGVFFLAKESPEVNSRISAELAYPSGGLHLTRDGVIYYGKLNGHVVRHDGDGFAMVFDDEYSFDILHKESAQKFATKGGR